VTADANKVTSLGSFVWSVADLLRGDFRQHDYGKIILPLVVLRRLDCILEATKEAVVKAAAELPEGIDDETRDMILYGAAGRNVKVYNLSRFTFATLRGQNPAQLHDNLVDYVTKFSPNVREILLDRFLFPDYLKRLKDAEILFQVFDRFCQIDLHPDQVSNLEMGYLFEDLIRRFSEIANDTAGEHFTPREIVHLIVDLLLAYDHEALTASGIIRTIYDCACGTGGMLSIGEEAMKELNPRIRVELFGQELNPESYAICKSDMLVKGHDPENIAYGNTLIADAHKDRKFHYMISNPPYGVDWKKYQDPIRQEADELGHDGRFGAGLSRISDGQLLFLQHLISKMRDDEAGSRIGIVMNGSPLFTGGAGSGESEIRRWMLENDWIDAIIALPTDLFYNTGIQTYVWLLSNRKPQERRGKVQLIDASGERFWRSMRKSLGSKRREIPDDARALIVQVYHDMLNGGGEHSDYSKIFDTTAFGYREIRIERPLRLDFQTSAERIERLANAKAFIQKFGDAEREEIIEILQMRMPEGLFTERAAFDAALIRAFKGAGVKLAAPLRKLILSSLSRRNEDAEICLDAAGNPEPDPELRDHELVPLNEDWVDYVAREVTPFVPDAWVDENYRDAIDGDVGRVGYEINFNRYFYRYVPPRPLSEIDAELKALEAEIAGLLKEVVT